MAHHCIPVTTGAPEFHTVEVGPFRVTDARFPPGLCLDRHVHQRPVIATILDGSFDDQFRTRTYECPTGTVLVEPAEESHANRFGAAGARVLVLEPDPSFDDLLRPCHRLLEQQGGRADPATTMIAARLARELYHRDAAATLAIEGLALELLASASRQRTAVDPRRQPPSWLRAARDVIHEECPRRRTVREIAAAVGVHPVRLGRSFHTYYRVPLATYLRRLRLQWAACQLDVTEEPISKIALRAGFADQSHFTRHFKREFGVTPRSYRSGTRS